MPDEEVRLDLLKVLSKAYFSTHQTEWIELESLWKYFQEAQIPPYYNDALRFEDDIGWLSHEGYLSRRGTGAVCVNSSGVERIKNRVLPEEWHVIGYEIGHAAWLQDRNREESEKRDRALAEKQSTKSTKGEKAMTPMSWVLVILSLVLVGYLIVHFR